MLQLARAIVGIVSDLLSLLALFVRSSGALRAENLLLRRQLARYLERGIKPRRVDYATRVSLALFSRRAPSQRAGTGRTRSAETDCGHPGNSPSAGAGCARAREVGARRPASRVFACDHFAVWVDARE
jgi:hypothetical protein